jgi:chromosome segregation ATPase
LIADNRALDKKVKDIEAEKASFQEKLRKIEKGVPSADGDFPKKLKENIDELKETIERKESQIKMLQEELSKAGKAAGRNILTPVPETAANKELKAQLSQLLEELTNARNESKKTKVLPEKVNTFETKQADSRLAELVVKKELELETARKESLSAQEKAFALQAKITNLENLVQGRQATQEQVRDIENKRLALESQLTDVQAALRKKNELAETLQQNIEYLNKQVSAKDEERKAIDAKLAGLESNTKQDIEKERARYEEVNVLYSSLKTQVTQFTEALAQKQTALEKRNEEIFNLRQEVASLKSKTQIFETELADAKDRQRKTLDDLIAAVRLNTALQERIIGGSVSQIDSQEKNKAEELKKKIEVILEPESR